MKRAIVNANLCKGCGLCVSFCPRHCIEMSDELNSLGYHLPKLHDPDSCTGCAMCAEMCPEIALKIFRKKKEKK